MKTDSRGRPGQRAIYGLANLVRHYRREDIEAACEKVLTLGVPSYQAVKRLLEQRAARIALDTAPDPGTSLIQAGDGIRPVDDYRAFFDNHTENTLTHSSTTEREPDEHVSH